jgi:hypothetical protein
LRDVSAGAIIIAHDEDTSPLRDALEGEGLSVEEVRGPYTAEQLTYSAARRCLVNHANAWRIAVNRDRPTIIVEADFVPVKGFADLPAPVPLDRSDTSMAYLYACGPQVWDLVTPGVARLLLQFYEEQGNTDSTGAYSMWDTSIGYWLKDRGVESYIPYRHYGEHGGTWNPEHGAAGMRRAHRADALHGQLAFMPFYANGSMVRYWKTRMWARAWGVLRLLTGRFLAWHDLARSEPLPMARFAVGRLLIEDPGSRT